MTAGFDLHTGFRAPERGSADTLAQFLHTVDRLPGIQRIHRAMREAMDLRDGEVLVDSGCGLGIETGRLATDHPDVAVRGTDRNEKLLTQAQERLSTRNLSWHVHDLTEPGELAGSADVVRTERVLIYQDDLAAAAEKLLRLLRPGGRLVSFELDYGAMLLPTGPFRPSLVDEIVEIMRDSLPQAWAGRRLPALLAERGLAVTSEPFSFGVNQQVWQRIVGDTLRTHAADRPEITEWLHHHETSGEVELSAAFTGVLTSARLETR
ncbi:MAG: methyltransferase domain-containing protein [Saccharopolyspora sp.]|uniref:methyltransferase domain-containing protein n=1 Tax=Saccharopolyspora sp. TaxID=33915 RepID=UPI0025EDD4A3|nr:methyltransferase domain-containing protein [Saccharopolyspora sp.]MBQ6643519.1 methyltransferase domain-containing protein [Saccharopolyspora sp.]